MKSDPVKKKIACNSLIQTLPDETQPKAGQIRNKEYSEKLSLP